MSAEGRARTGRLRRAVAGVGAALVVAGLFAAIASLPRSAPGLAEAAQRNLAATGSSHPVTAALLDYRAYDTLLELAVLLLAAIAMLALRRGRPAPPPPGSDVLTVLVRVQLPIMILVAGYVLWAGSDAPGGAFQAGAVLAAAGALALLAGAPMPSGDGRLALRVGLAAGLATFVAVGLACVLTSGVFLDVPADEAARLLLLLEIAATLSVALTLLGMFVSILYDEGRGADPGGGSR